MKINVKLLVVSLLMLVLIMTSCSDVDTMNDNLVVDELVSDKAVEGKSTDNSVLDQEASLKSEELLNDSKKIIPESSRIVREVDEGDGIKIITTYQKGYSTREETFFEGQTEIFISNIDSGNYYKYMLGETVGTMIEFSDMDWNLLAYRKSLEGKSLMAILEENINEETKLFAEIDTIKDRQAIKVKYIFSDSEEAVTYWYDREYLIELMMVANYSGDWSVRSEVVDIEFNVILEDDLFDAPDNMEFSK